MREEILVAGFGGQGILFAGKLLAWAGLKEGKEVTCIPSYGAEMRGGTANCHVILSSEIISSPVIERPTILVVLNRQSLDRFEDSLITGGTVIMNSTLVDRKVRRKDLEIFSLPASELAEELGSILVSNMIMLGALVQIKKLVSLRSLKGSLPHLLKGKESFLTLNERALDKGYKYAEENFD